MLVAALAQLFGVVAGPLDHWRTPSRLGMHAEATGSSASHYAHDEATCVACAISAVVASPSRRIADVKVYVVNQVHAREHRVWVPSSARHVASAPRAPPTDSRLG